MPKKKGSRKSTRVEQKGPREITKDQVQRVQSTEKPDTWIKYLGMTFQVWELELDFAFWIEAEILDQHGLVDRTRKIVKHGVAVPMVSGKRLHTMCEDGEAAVDEAVQAIIDFKPTGPHLESETEDGDWVEHDPYVWCRRGLKGVLRILRLSKTQRGDNIGIDAFKKFGPIDLKAQTADDEVEETAGRADGDLLDIVEAKAPDVQTASKMGHARKSSAKVVESHAKKASGGNGDTGSVVEGRVNAPNDRAESDDREDGTVKTNADLNAPDTRTDHEKLNSPPSNDLVWRPPIISKARSAMRTRRTRTEEVVEATAHPTLDAQDTETSGDEKRVSDQIEAGASKASAKEAMVKNTTYAMTARKRKAEEKESGDAVEEGESGDDDQDKADKKPKLNKTVPEDTIDDVEMPDAGEIKGLKTVPKGAVRSRGSLRLSTGEKQVSGFEDKMGSIIEMHDGDLPYAPPGDDIAIPKGAQDNAIFDGQTTQAEMEQAIEDLREQARRATSPLSQTDGSDGPQMEQMIEDLREQAHRATSPLSQIDGYFGAEKAAAYTADASAAEIKQRADQRAEAEKREVLGTTRRAKQMVREQKEEAASRKAQRQSNLLSNAPQAGIVAPAVIPDTFAAQEGAGLIPAFEAPPEMRQNKWLPDQLSSRSLAETTAVQVPVPSGGGGMMKQKKTRGKIAVPENAQQSGQAHLFGLFQAETSSPTDATANQAPHSAGTMAPGLNALDTAAPAVTAAPSTSLPGPVAPSASVSGQAVASDISAPTIRFIDTLKSWSADELTRMNGVFRHTGDMAKACAVLNKIIETQNRARVRFGQAPRPIKTVAECQAAVNAGLGAPVEDG